MMNLKKLTVAMMAVGLSSAAVAGNVKGQQHAADHSAAVAAMNANVDAVKGHEGGSADWYRRIRMSGMVNVDAVYSGYDNIDNVVSADAEHDKADQNQTQIAVSNATLFVDAAMSNWSSAHVGFSYENRHADQFAPVMQNRTDNEGWSVDEAFVTLANFNKMPVYARAGQQFVNFGDYQVHPMFDSYTQLLSETNGPAVTVGFVSPMGVYGSVFALDGTTEVDNRNLADNYGGRVGFGHHAADMGYDVHFDYMRNMGDATYVNQKITFANDANENMTHRVGAVSAHADFNTGPFDVSADFVNATRHFEGAELGYNPDSLPVTDTDAGAEPWATGLHLGYKFRMAGHRSHLVVGYERSGGTSANATGVAGLDMPSTRYSAEYNVNMFRHTDFAVGVVSDHDYSTDDGGSGKNGTTGIARVSFQFA